MSFIMKFVTQQKKENEFRYIYRMTAKQMQSSIKEVN